ncbi:unnamed protein product [Closterium sp. NIES-53]
MKEIQKVQQQLMKNFKCKTLGEVKYYLGMHVERDLDHRWLKLHQEKFIKELGEKYGIENERKSLVGSLWHAAVHTRPDISFSVGQLARVVQNPSEEQVDAAERVVKYLNSHPSIGVQYSASAQVKQKEVEVLKEKGERLGEGKLFLTCFTDATWASEKDDPSSVGGYICVVGGGHVNTTTAAATRCKGANVAEDVASVVLDAEQRRTTTPTTNKEVPVGVAVQNLDVGTCRNRHQDGGARRNQKNGANIVAENNPKSNGGAEKKERTAVQFFHIGEQGEQGDASAKVGAELHPLDYWVLDTGAAWTMTQRKELLDDVRAAPINEVCSASGHALKLAGAGRAALKGADGKPVVLHNVLLVPDLKANLISLRKLAKAGVSTSTDGARTYKELGTRARMCTDPCGSCRRWRGTMGGKLEKGLHPRGGATPVTSRSKKPLELVHMDLVGPLPVQGHKGAYPLKQKEHAAFTIKEDWLPFVEKQAECVGKRIRTDRGGEFLGAETTAWLKKQGIQREQTTAYSPQSNGVAERANQTILETARALLIESGVGNSMWPHAVRHATVARNRVLTKVAHVPKKYRRKLGASAIWCVHLGLAAESKGWLLWEPSKGVLFNSMDVKFVEGMMYGGWKKQPETKVSQQMEQITMQLDLTPSMWEEEEKAAVEGSDGEKVQEAPGGGGDSTKEAAGSEGGEQQLGKSKSRLVAKGFMQKEKQDFNEIFAPTAKPPTLRVLLADAAVTGKFIFQMDISTAFLNEILDENVYMTRPPGYKDSTGRVSKLKMSIYGLKQAPRCWYQKLAAVLEEMGFRTSSCEQSLFLKGEGEKLVLFVVYVDDILLFSSSMKEIQKVQQQLMKNFKCKTLGEVKYYLGMHVERDLGHLWLKLLLEKFIKELGEKYGIENERKVATPLSAEFKLVKAAEDEGVEAKEQQQYQSLYAAVHTRPDISFSVGQLARVVQNPSEEQVDAAERVVKYLNSHPSI